MENKLLDLADNKVKVIVSILQVISEEDKEYSLVHISSRISMSTRSTQRYINLLGNLLQDYNNEKNSHFDMVQNSRGVRISINRNANINFFISYLFQKDDTIKLLLSMLTQEYVSISDYIEASFIGTYAVNKSIEMINSLLQPFNLEVDRKKFSIQGPEIAIRFFLHSVFWLVYRCDDFPDKFHLIDQNKLKDDVNYLMANIGVSSNNPVKEKDIMFRIAISLLRCQKKCFVALTEKQRKIVPIYQNQYGNPTFFETVETILNNHQIFDSEEVYFLILSLLHNNLLFTSKTIKNQLIMHQQRNDLDALKATILFLDKFQEYVHEIPHDKTEAVFDFIFRSHLNASIHNNTTHDYLSHIFDDITNQSHEYVQQLQKIIKELQASYSFDLFDNEHYLLNKYIVLKYFLNLKLLYKKPIKIKLHTDFPYVYEVYVKEYLSIHFKNEYKLLFIENDMYQENDLTLTFFKMDNMDEKTVNVSYPLTLREIAYLKNKFDEIEKRV